MSTYPKSGFTLAQVGPEKELKVVLGEVREDQKELKMDMVYYLVINEKKDVTHCVTIPNGSGVPRIRVFKSTRDLIDGLRESFRP